ncbi:MAG TPA: hypothetical protein VGE97_00385 [Nitrososphaera sp.]|jgi:hypothetical protein
MKESIMGFLFLKGVYILMDGEMLQTVNHAGKFLRQLGEILESLDPDKVTLDMLYWLQDGVQTVNNTMRLAIQYETEERAQYLNSQ